MTLDKRARDEMLAHCGRVHEDDGVDPREFFKKRGSRTTPNSRKAAQLCSQVAETLGLVLAGELDDELLHNLQVVSVEPAPDATQLLVIVRADLPTAATNAQQIAERLATIAGWLRTEIAGSITRKKAPRLVFHILSAADDGEGKQ